MTKVREGARRTWDNLKDIVGDDIEMKRRCFAFYDYTGDRKALEFAKDQHFYMPCSC